MSTAYNLQSYVFGLSRKEIIDDRDQLLTNLVKSNKDTLYFCVSPDF